MAPKKVSNQSDSKAKARHDDSQGVVDQFEPIGNRQWSSQELFGDQREILITHGEDVYRLRKTRNGKLILNK